MDAYMRRTRIIFALVVAISVGLTVFGVYRPMADEIEKGAIEHFHLVAKEKANAFGGTISQHIQAAKALASRSAIRDKILDYRSGAIGFDTLQAYTRDKYREGAMAIDSLGYAARVVDGRVVAYLRGGAYAGGPLPDFEETRVLTYSIRHHGGSLCMEVVSPILHEGEPVGWDLLGFNLDGTMAALNRQASLTLELAGLGSGKTRLPGYSKIFEDAEKLYYIEPVGSRIAIAVSQSKEEVFAIRDELAGRNLLYAGLGYMAVLGLVYVLIVGHARREIKSLAKDRDSYRRRAVKDALTGAGSRAFLEDFISRHPYEQGQLVLVDLDDFKGINDTYGHTAGDRALVAVAAAIRETIRSDDQVIRYGGDEFLVILRDHGRDSGEQVVLRLRERLGKLEELPFEVRFSYGVGRSGRWTGSRRPSRRRTRRCMPTSAARNLEKNIAIPFEGWYNSSIHMNKCSYVEM